MVYVKSQSTQGLDALDEVDDELGRHVQRADAQNVFYVTDEYTHEFLEIYPEICGSWKVEVQEIENPFQTPDPEADLVVFSTVKTGRAVRESYIKGYVNKL